MADPVVAGSTMVERFILNRSTRPLIEGLAGAAGFSVEHGARFPLRGFNPYVASTYFLPQPVGIVPPQYYGLPPELATHAVGRRFLLGAADPEFLAGEQADAASQPARIRFQRALAAPYNLDISPTPALIQDAQILVSALDRGPEVSAALAAVRREVQRRNAIETARVNAALDADRARGGIVLTRFGAVGRQPTAPPGGGGGAVLGGGDSIGGYTPRPGGVDLRFPRVTGGGSGLDRLPPPTAASDQEAAARAPRFLAGLSSGRRDP